jgi:hypothetical protein
MEGRFARRRSEFRKGGAMDPVQRSDHPATRWQKLLLFAALAALPVLACAQEKKAQVLQKPAPPIGASQPAEAEPEPTLDISVFPGDKNRTVSGGFQVYVSVINTTKDTIRTAFIGACMPLAVGEVVADQMSRPAPSPSQGTGDATGATLEAKKAAERNRGAICRPLTSLSAVGKEREKPVAIPPGRQAYFSLDVPRVPIRATFEQIFFRRDAYPFHIHHWYTTTKEPDISRVHRGERAIEIRPAIFAPLIGVFAGNLLVAFFLALRSEGARVTAALSPQTTFSGRELTGAVGSWFLSFARMVVSGFISGLILVVVLNQTDTPQLPVTVSINDFWGGAFLGLLSYKLSDWLFEKFFTRKDGGGAQQTPPANAPAKPAAVPTPGGTKP